MTVYSFTDTIPANTAASAPREHKLKLCPGVIVQAIVNPPHGVQFLARFQLLDGLLNVLPGREDEYYTGEGGPESLPMWYELRKSPYELTWITWNVDDFYPHEILLKLVVLPFEAASQLKEMKGILEKLENLSDKIGPKQIELLTQLSKDIKQLLQLMQGTKRK